VGFLAGDEAGAHPDALGAQRQAGGEAAAVIEAAGADHGDLHRFDRLGQQRQGADEARMAAAFAALADDRVTAGLLGLDRVLHRAADDHDLEAGLLELLHDRHGHARGRR
jgi:hypothetical protein